MTTERAEIRDWRDDVCEKCGAISHCQDHDPFCDGCFCDGHCCPCWCHDPTYDWGWGDLSDDD